MRLSRLPISRPSLLPRFAQLAVAAGCAAILQPSDASATPSGPVPPAGPLSDGEPPWAGSDGTPPPLPFARTRAAIPPPHPAIHSSLDQSAPLRPLFPSAGEVLERKAERRAAMERHPAGKAIASPRSGIDMTKAARSETRNPAGIAWQQTGKAIVDKSTASCARRHRVQPGETLWGIARRWSGSERPVEILRLTREIHRLNRDTIGPDPDLILPGQILHLPEACER